MTTKTRKTSVERSFFPRSSDLPLQSPFFWVQQKDRYLRQLLIKDIEKLTSRRFVVYFANRYSNGSQIQASDVAYVAELLGDLGSEPVDILLETNGGETDSTEAIISLLGNISQDVRVVIANAAKSNGTLIALASAAILMGSTSEMGPIEPSIGGIPCSILDTPKVAADNFALHMAGVYALRQSRTLASIVLTRGMMRDKTPEAIERVVHALATRDEFHSHGSVVDIKKALELGLNAIYLQPDDELWKRVWLLYLMYDFDCRRDRLAKVFEGRARSLAVAAPTS